MENLLFLGVPILKHIRVFITGTPECNHSVNDIVTQAVQEAEMYQQAGVVSLVQCR